MPRKYSKEYKDEIVKECIETNNYGIVARKHKIPPTTVFTWLNREKNKSNIQQKKSAKKLQKELADVKLENAILKDLLKKSHQLWLKE